MARRPLTGDVEKITEEIGKTYEGHYLGSRTTDAGHKNNDGSTKLSVIHTLDMKTGPVSFWGFTAIDNSLAQVKQGSYLWITYRGRSSKGQKPHMVDIDVDDELLSTSADPNDAPDAYPPSLPTVDFDPDELPANPLGLKKQEVPF